MSAEHQATERAHEWKELIDQTVKRHTLEIVGILSREQTRQVDTQNVQQTADTQIEEAERRSFKYFQAYVRERRAHRESRRKLRRYKRALQLLKVQMQAMVQMQAVEQSTTEE